MRKIILILLLFVVAVCSYAQVKRSKFWYGSFIHPSIGFVTGWGEASKAKGQNYRTYGVDVSWVILAYQWSGYSFYIKPKPKNSKFQGRDFFPLYLGFCTDFRVTSEDSVKNKRFNFSMGPTIGVGLFSFDFAYHYDEDFNSGYTMRANLSLFVIHVYLAKHYYKDASEREIGLMLKLPISWGDYVSYK